MSDLDQYHHWANVSRVAVVSGLIGFYAVLSLWVRRTIRRARALIKRGRHEVDHE